MSIVSKASTFKTNAIREGINLVRKILATQDCSKGLTTAELYQLALREAPPQDYKGDLRLRNRPLDTKGISLPPQNDHPVRSKAFLKRSILPVLQGSKEITKAVANREATTPIPLRGKKGKILARGGAQGTAHASPSSPVIIKAWVWKPFDPADAKPKTQPIVTAAFGTSVGVGEDWSHLNKRRQGSREEKVQRDVAAMKQLQARERRAATVS
ncbi:hypothetical protein P691DRAFT_701661 [Macrolepiota fuliginosa MF-IS2]|uniref:Uncharacterized protein n=1 Tax=Macrolepiota fuliginosa MF-IS2 TaxID=1400762 RepID=A0A9P5XH11_9AGAR|nr:hypothetical protein P691DRAFT_701661 [Macrolepiota fuliginosa MF-IS2]